NAHKAHHFHHDASAHPPRNNRKEIRGQPNNIRKKKLIESAEDVTHTLHNTYSLRGAKIREPLPWSKYINQAIVRWGDKAEIIMAQHHWPTWGNENVVNLLKSQRDLYRY
ncbi:hypothetical protein QIG11_26535, partial [Klebsiella pneumoniae]|nr:hypothetical protein [Klebsiella pneumoniae]